jgi:hypothetical protein
VAANGQSIQLSTLRVRVRRFIQFDLTPVLRNHLLARSDRLALHVWSKVVSSRNPRQPFFQPG